MKIARLMWRDLAGLKFDAVHGYVRNTGSRTDVQTISLLGPQYFIPDANRLVDLLKSL